MADDPTILIADDDPHIRQVVRFAVQKEGFETVEAEDGAETLEQFDDAEPALVVLDIMMPEMDGTEVCRQLRAETDVPIVFLSSKDEEIDRVLGLEMGGDDYVTKPFSPRELIARIKAVMRRVDGQVRAGGADDDQAGDEPESEELSHGKLRLNLDEYRAFWEDHEVDLTRREFELLEVLMGYPGKVFSRNELMDRAYGRGVVVSDRTIDSHVRRLRDKFDEFDGKLVETVHGVGYRLGDCE